MKRNETGRSMVEMIAVLAIIGVLSVTALYGYTIAYRKYRANEIVQIASILATKVGTANAGEGGCIKLSDTDITKTPGGVNVEMVAYDVLDSNVTVDIQIIDGDTNDELCNAIRNTQPSNRNIGYTIHLCGEGEVSCTS